MKKTEEYQFLVGDTVCANIYGKIGTGKVLERVRDGITNSNKYYVEFEFANNFVSKVWIFESSLVKVN